MKFELHDQNSAPEAVQEDFAAANKAYGAIPNLYRGLAANSATLKVYLAFNELLKEHGQLTPVEQQLVYLTVSAENGCTYCVGAHSVLSAMVSMPQTMLDDLRAQRPLSDPKLNQLREFTLSVMHHCGYVPEADLQALESAGYDQRHVLEVLTILAQKTLSNYFNHMAQTPLDEMFMSQQWTPND